MDDFWRKEEKLDWLKNNPLKDIQFETIHPDNINNWINLTEENDWEELMPVRLKETKSNRSTGAIFELYTLGTISNRDEWVYDFDMKILDGKIAYFVRKWAAWGKALMDLQINFETVEPYNLKVNTFEIKAEAKRQKVMFLAAQEPEELYTTKPKVKPKLRVIKESGIMKLMNLPF
jgi:predicted helicase